MSTVPISHSLHAKSNSIPNHSFLKNTGSKIIGIFILVLGLILIVVTALSLPSITPIWSPLIPLGVLIIAVTIFCILSKSQKTAQKKEPSKQIVETKNMQTENLPTSQTSTRKNSLTSLLEDELQNEEPNLSLTNKNIYKSDSSSSLNTILSEAINQAFPASNEKISSISEIEDL